MAQVEQKLGVTGDVTSAIKMNREHTRTYIAKGIFKVFVGLLIALIAISCWKGTSFSDYNVIISPFISLLGVILGFYFGKESE